jgi:hypothetical protein
MIKISKSIAAGGTIYIPVPARGVVAGVKAVWQSTVTTSNILTVSRGATTVNLVTVVTTAGMVAETGVPDATNKGLVFDPDTAAYSFIKLVLSGGNSIAAEVLIDFDDSAFVAKAASEA